MDIFYLKKSEFLPFIKIDSLKSFSQRDFKSESKELEHCCARFLTQFTAKHIFGVKNLEITTENSKPHFVSNEVCFSISHSKDIVLTAFNRTNIGADVEFMKKRDDYSAIMKRYGEKTDNPSSEEFYRFWTLNEAEIKLNSQIKSIFTRILEKDYMLTCVCDDIFISNFRIRKLCCKGKNTDLRNELENPRNVEIKSV